MEPIRIRMLGEFSLHACGNTISDAGNRSRKVWGLLAYLVCNRDRMVSQQKLIDLLWGEDSGSTNPENALRITLHRLRTLLDQLWSGAGQELILRRDGSYLWNRQADIQLDCDRFEALFQSQPQEEEQRLRDCLEALSLYQGEFLPRHSGETWVIPIAAHFHNCFLQLTLEAAALLSDRNRHREAATLCRTAIAADPYHEPLHQRLMQELAATGDRNGAAAAYEALSKRLFDDFGIRPNEETRAVYRAAAHSPGDRTLLIDEVLEHLQEPPGSTGAMECDYDYFKVLCYAQNRAMERSGTVTHIALLSITGSTGKPLSRQSLQRVMEQLGQTLRSNLRRVDCISRCSVSQYILMLPNANYENSDMVCRRVIAAFHRAYPHTAVKVSFIVQPLTPSICVP